MLKYKVLVIQQPTERNNESIAIEKTIECDNVSLEGQSIVFYGSQNQPINIIAIYPCTNTIVTKIND